ncbi:MAG: hypothetical protein JSS04_09095 [Proteobacteria bacterium]|nr:hypothetical protein [Pseudomonadota bacterium]
MITMTFDNLAYIDRLKAVGFTEPQARGMADGLDQALREKVSRADLLAVMKASRRNIRAILVLVFVAQTAVFVGLDLLGR